MKTKIIIIILIALIAVIAVGWFFLPSAPIKITDKNITDNTNPFIIKITYPQITGLDDFNKKVKDIIDKEISGFKTNSLANDEAVKKVDPVSYAKYPRTYELDIGYDKGQVDNNIVSVVFNVYKFEGGAHGASYFVPLNYNVKNKKEIAIANLFPNDKNYLQKISDFCITELTKQITETNWIAEGAGPKAENFADFLINKDNLVLYFSQYQVAPGAAGHFKVIFSR